MFLFGPFAYFISDTTWGTMIGCVQLAAFGLACTYAAVKTKLWVIPLVVFCWIVTGLFATQGWIKC